MCSNGNSGAAPAAHDGDLGARLGSAIDELAAAVAAEESGRDLTARLAAAWALVAAADPQLAERTARYSR